MLEALEKSRLSELETVIEGGLKTFVDVGMALAEIQRDKLYRVNFSTFEDYCRRKWSISRPRAYQLIESAEAVTEMSNLLDKPISQTADEQCIGDFTVSTIVDKQIPAVTHERHAAELAKIKDPEQRAEVWQTVNEVAKEVETVVTTNLIKQAVQAHSNGHVNKEVVAENIKARQEHLTAVKNSPGMRWVSFLTDIQGHLNSIRDNGGMARLAVRWTQSDRIAYLKNLHTLNQSITAIAEQLQGEIHNDN